MSEAKVLQVGDTASLTRAFSEADVRTYAELCGDKNPVHLDAEYAADTQFGERIVHGMLVSSLFSTLLGMHLPGRRRHL
ncbi:MAG: MaoC family dehydratase [Thiolinea sp.]